MTAFGALFAFLTAFVITIEWNQHRDVEKTVGEEADACVRLIWASESPGCDGPGTRRLLLEYLRSVRHVEWPTLAMGPRRVRGDAHPDDRAAAPRPEDGGQSAT